MKLKFHVSRKMNCLLTLIKCTKLNLRKLEFCMNNYFESERLNHSQCTLTVSEMPCLLAWLIWKCIGMFDSWSSIVWLWGITVRNCNVKSANRFKCA